MNTPYYTVESSGQTVAKCSYKQDAIKIANRYTDVSVFRTGNNGSEREVYSHLHHGAAEAGHKTVADARKARRNQ